MRSNTPAHPPSAAARSPSHLAALAALALPILAWAAPAQAKIDLNGPCAQRCKAEKDACWDRCISNGGTPNDCSAGCGYWYDICMNSCDAVGPIDPWGGMYAALRTDVLSFDELVPVVEGAELSSAVISEASAGAASRVETFVDRVASLSDDEITAEDRAALLDAAADLKAELLQPEGGCINLFGEDEAPAGDVEPARPNPIRALALLTEEADISSPDSVSELLSILGSIQATMDGGAAEAADIGFDVGITLSEAMDHQELADPIRSVLDALVLDGTLEVKQAVACLPPVTQSTGIYEMNASGYNYHSNGVCDVGAWGHHALLWKAAANVFPGGGSYNEITLPVPGQINRDVQCVNPTNDNWTLDQIEAGALGNYYFNSGGFPIDPAGTWGCTETNSWNAAAGFIGMAMAAWHTPVYMDMIDSSFSLGITRYGVVKRIEISVPGSTPPDALCGWIAGSIPAMMNVASLCTAVLTVEEADIGYWDETLVPGPTCAYDEATVPGSKLQSLFSDSLFINGGQADFIADPPEEPVPGLESVEQAAEVAAAYDEAVSGGNIRVEIQAHPARF